APDADAVGGDAVLLRPRADEADGTLRVLQRHRMTIARPEAVVQHEGGDAATDEPIGDLLALVVEGEATVAAAGADDDGGGSALVLGGEVDVEFGLVAVLLTEGARGTLGPEELGLHRRRSVGGGGERGGEGEQQRGHGGSLGAGRRGRRG